MPSHGIDVDCYVTLQRTYVGSGQRPEVLCVQGWFVPSLEELEAGGQSGAGDKAVTRPSAGGTTATAAKCRIRSGSSYEPGSHTKGRNWNGNQASDDGETRHSRSPRVYTGLEAHCRTSHVCVCMPLRKMFGTVTCFSDHLFIIVRRTTSAGAP